MRVQHVFWTVNDFATGPPQERLELRQVKYSLSLFLCHWIKFIHSPAHGEQTSSGVYIWPIIICIPNFSSMNESGFKFESRSSNLEALINDSKFGIHHAWSTVRIWTTINPQNNTSFDWKKLKYSKVLEDLVWEISFLWDKKWSYLTDLRAFTKRNFTSTLVHMLRSNFFFFTVLMC